MMEILLGESTAFFNLLASSRSQGFGLYDFIWRTQQLPILHSFGSWSFVGSALLFLLMRSLILFISSPNCILMSNNELALQNLLIIQQRSKRMHRTPLVYDNMWNRQSH